MRAGNIKYVIVSDSYTHCSDTAIGRNYTTVIVVSAQEVQAIDLITQEPITTGHSSLVEGLIR